MDLVLLDNAQIMKTAPEQERLYELLYLLYQAPLWRRLRAGLLHKGAWVQETIHRAPTGLTCINPSTWWVLSGASA
ncbi:hypothetical protein TNCV_7461 [Trichonephila clavipes]|nr:hypothetical protein TNCV_7461 [Trichonephila clavipes]